MRYFIGLAEDDLKNNKARPIEYDPTKLLNAHMLVTGPSGSGKSYQTLRFLAGAAEAGLAIDVFDVHEELANIPAGVSVKYSQHTRYGYNPLVLDTDKHTGGVIRQADFIVGLIKSVTPSLGDLQAVALRNLIIDTYAANGIFANDPTTWDKKIISEQEHERIANARAWKELRAYYPTLTDLENYAKRQHRILTLGADNKAITSFDHLAKTLKSLHRANSKYARESDRAELEKLETSIASLKQKAVEAYSNAVDGMETGSELDQLYKYDSAKQITSLLARLDTLNTTGIFHPNHPPFGGSRVKIHEIKSLTPEQQILFIKLRLKTIFEHYKKMGPTPSGRELRHICFIDEAHKIITDDDHDIVNVITREARKYGVALWLASQNPTDFPQSFLTNCGTTVLLGVHTAYWKRCNSMLQIRIDQLQQIKPTEVLAIKQQRAGQSDPPFELVAVPNPASDTGRRVSAYLAKMSSQPSRPLARAGSR